MRAETADVRHPAVEEVAVGLVDVVDVVFDGESVVLCVDDGGAELVALHHVCNENVVVEDVIVEGHSVGLQEGVYLIAGHGSDGDGLAVGTAFLHE